LRDVRERSAKVLRDLGEFALIARIARAARRVPSAGIELGIGDDAALLPARRGETWVVSTDARVENVHFRWSTDAPRTVGATALAAALSDLAAMGARPRGFTCALAAPGDLPLATFDGVLRGLVDGARRHACPLVGGNLTRASETSLVLTVLGGVARGRALRRRARIGDRILVTGELGATALARARAERHGAALRRVPVPRLAQGQALARIGAVTGCIDVSDGLAADLGHLLGGGRRCAIDPARLPLPRGFAAASRRLGLDPTALALAGGDDYELLFALRPEGPSAAALARRLGVRVTELGRVERGASPRARAGFDHFAGRTG
jgi:thiamine-monophosphate kinase